MDLRKRTKRTTEEMTDLELLKLILGKRKNTEYVCKAAEEYGGVYGLVTSGVDELKDAGIREQDLNQLRGVGELSKRMWNAKLEPKADMSSPRNVAEYYMQSLRNEDQEQVYIMLLDTRNRLKKSIMIGLGTVSACSVSPREIYKKALAEGAAGVVLVHNHPSGDPQPSGEDIQFTRTLKEGGKLLAVPLLDSLIIGDNSYYSFKEEGML